MKKIVLLLILIIPALAANVFAVPKGKTITFTTSPRGKVIFAGTIHNNITKMGCRECHNPQLFPKMQQGSVAISMRNIYAGKQCGFCHNGQRAFTPQGNCQRCHKR